MPPKFIPKKDRKPKGGAAKGAEETPDASPCPEFEGGSMPAGAEADAPAAAAGAGGAAVGAADGTTAAPSAACGAGGAVDAAATDAALAAAKAAEEAYLSEPLPGEEHHHRLMDEAMNKINLTTSTRADKIHPNSRDIKVQNLTMILKGKELLVDTDLDLAYGCRYGLVGNNGCGKSLMMTVLGRRLLPIPRNLDLFHLQSEIEPSDMTALEAVTAVDVERRMLQHSIDDLEGLVTGEDSDEQAGISERLFDLYERLEALGADNAESKASVILYGLGFTKETMGKRCRDFSGGWRMRIALARALFVSPSCLLLDEPSAHLDMEAVVWLERYLSTYKGILLLVSHSQDFMNNVCTDIIRMHGRRLAYYGGNYDTYRMTRAEKEENQSRKYDKQQADVASLKDFVARFGHGTKKMAQQAQSREKLLAKVLEEDSVEKVEKDAVFKMRFPNPGKLPPPVLQMQNLSFAYPGGDLLYDMVDFGVDLDSRVALVGPNGKGKTTLLKMMAGELVPITGAVRPHPHLRIERYTQHFVDTLDLGLAPLEYFQKLLPDLPPEEVRKRIGRYGVTGENQLTKMAYLSNGIKSRVVFAKLALRTPHLLLLDEPTNGLDIETIDSLAEAIKAFEGGVVLVSHDMRLISQVARDIYECDHAKITLFRGSIEEYKAMLQTKLDSSEAAFEASRRKIAATKR